MRKHCYFLCYRVSGELQSIPWDKPTGGLVMEPARFVQGHPISDMPLAYDVVKQRYHCGPHEELVMAEVFEKREMRKARILHKKWEWEMSTFLEMMDCA